jgi:hypothetical protein
MRIFFSQAPRGSSVDTFLPLLIDAGDTVSAMTRSAMKAGLVESAGAQVFVCDVFDRPGLRSAARAFAPDLVLHELGDLPDDLENLPDRAHVVGRFSDRPDDDIGMAGAAGI